MNTIQNYQTASYSPSFRNLEIKKEVAPLIENCLPDQRMNLALAKTILENTDYIDASVKLNKAEGAIEMTVAPRNRDFRMPFPKDGMYPVGDGVHYVRKEGNTYDVFQKFTETETNKNGKTINKTKYMGDSCKLTENEDGSLVLHDFDNFPDSCLANFVFRIDRAIKTYLTHARANKRMVNPLTYALTKMAK